MCRRLCVCVPFCLCLSCTAFVVAFVVIELCARTTEPVNADHTARTNTHRREEGNLSILGGNPLRALFCLFCTGPSWTEPQFPVCRCRLRVRPTLALFCTAVVVVVVVVSTVCPSNGIAHSLAHCRLWRRYSLKSSSSSALCTLCRFVHSSATVARPRRLLSPFSQVASSFSSLLRFFHLYSILSPC